MGLAFRKLKKLWIIYLFLLFFSFFMFAISINVYLQSLNSVDIRQKNTRSHKRTQVKNRENIIVANYVGTGNIFGNITKDDLNLNDFSPVEFEGALGRPVVIPPRETLIMQRKFQINRFNILASDRIPLNRTLKDYRNNDCAARNYTTMLPKTSVIIVFHNEAWSVLLRTVWSVINRSPRHLIDEILLVDDASDREFLKVSLDEYVETLPIRTRVLRLKKREGLVPARLLGAHNAKGDVLTFLDAHCECSPGWLEPLLDRIRESPKSVVCPVIDIISDDSFSYTKTFENHWGAFNWNLHFRWFVLGGREIKERLHDATKPIATPAMAGGLFAIRKDYFFEMGSYDAEMKIWGGENVEMSFRIWMCGGLVEITPCSHVGHLFRKSSPYTFPGGVNQILQNNLARAALVWMDEWSDFFFLYNNISTAKNEHLNVDDRVSLREKLNCKSFKWYLENVWPSNFFPADDRFFGKIVLLSGKTSLNLVYKQILYSIPGRLAESDWSVIFRILIRQQQKLLNGLDVEKDSCLRSSGDSGVYGTSFLTSAIVGSCKQDAKLQDIFVITSNGQIMTNENICIDCIDETPNKKNLSNVRFFQCHDNERQFWKYDINTLEIRHSSLNLCLTAGTPTKNKGLLVEAFPCEGNSSKQQWALIPLVWKS